MSRGFGRSVSPGEAFTNNLGSGAAIGAGAFVVNYVLMYVFVIIDGVELGDEGWKSVGTVLYNAQFVATEASSGGQSFTFNLVTGSASNELVAAALGESDVASTIPSILYHLAPIVVLAVAGVLAAQAAGSRLETGSAAAAGATIVPGTAVLSVLGVFLFESSGETGGSVGPELVMGVLLVGLVIPAVAGALGGVLSNEL